MSATTANTPTRSEAQALLAMLERMRAKLVMQRAELARQLRDMSNRVDGIDRQLDDQRGMAVGGGSSSEHTAARLTA